MSTINVEAFTRKLREVVADEPKAFAYDLGLSLSAVYNYLNGRVPATDVLFRIAQYTGRPMEWFLVEAIVLSSVGGILGSGLGVLSAVLIGRLADWPILISPAAVVTALLFSGMVGLGFGVYPARRAARLDPITALRHE